MSKLSKRIPLSQIPTYTGNRERIWCHPSLELPKSRTKKEKKKSFSKARWQNAAVVVSTQSQKSVLGGTFNLANSKEHYPDQQVPDSALKPATKFPYHCDSSREVSFILYRRSQSPGHQSQFQETGTDGSANRSHRNVGAPNQYLHSSNRQKVRQSQPYVKWLGDVFVCGSGLTPTS